MAAKVEMAARAKEKMLYNFNNLMSQICVYLSALSQGCVQQFVYIKRQINDLVAK